MNVGREPALVGLDFMHSGRNYNWYNDMQPIEDARSYYNRHGIPAICWHWRDPSKQTEEFYTAKTNFNINNIFDENSEDYKSMLHDIDYISELLKELQKEDIPVIWRPLHEAAGGWFWWGAKGAAPCKKLYQVMFDRMVNHHGLNNLIWVWTREPNDDAWYPGDEYVDIVSRDIYKDGDHSSHVNEWNDMHVRYDQKKIIALSECGSFPDVENLVEDRASWSWFMPWYGQFVRDAKYNSLDLWKKMLAHEYVITLDEMPDLRTYEGIEHPVSIEEQSVENGLQVFPTEVHDTLFLRSSSKIRHVTIYDPAGRVQLTAKLNAEEGTISLKALQNGLYLVRVDDRAVVKILKK